MRPYDRPLAGLEPGFVKFTMERSPTERNRWEVVLWTAQGRGFCAAPRDRYEGLTWGEATDVVSAVLDVLAPRE